jgi:hypothetical protein
MRAFPAGKRTADLYLRHRGYDYQGSRSRSDNVPLRMDAHRPLVGDVYEDQHAQYDIYITKGIARGIRISFGHPRFFIPPRLHIAL